MRYRNFYLNHDYPPIPDRRFDWSATHEDYEPGCDSDQFPTFSGPTKMHVMTQVDLWYRAQEESTWCAHCDEPLEPECPKCLCCGYWNE